MARRLLLFVPLLLLAGAVALLVLRERELNCAEPFLRSVSPDQRYSLTVCRRASLRLAMPGQGSDGPGWVVLRDAQGRIAGVVAMDALIEIGHPPRWTAETAELPLVAQFALPAQASPLGDHGWGVRALAGLVPASAEFR